MPVTCSRSMALLRWGLLSTLVVSALELSTWCWWGRGRELQLLPAIARDDLTCLHGEVGTPTAAPTKVLLTRLAQTECGDCATYRYMSTSTPLYSEVYTCYARTLEMTEFFSHRQLWVLGGWLLISDSFDGSS